LRFALRPGKGAHGGHGGFERLLLGFLASA
jgi:hypothetical protein